MSIIAETTFCTLCGNVNCKTHTSAPLAPLPYIHFPTPRSQVPFYHDDDDKKTLEYFIPNVNTLTKCAKLNCNSEATHPCELKLCVLNFCVLHHKHLHRKCRYLGCTDAATAWSTDAVAECCLPHYNMWFSSILPFCIVCQQFTEIKCITCDKFYCAYHNHTTSATPSSAGGHFCCPILSSEGLPYFDYDNVKNYFIQKNFFPPYLCRVTSCINLATRQCKSLQCQFYFCKFHDDHYHRACQLPKCDKLAINWSFEHQTEICGDKSHHLPTTKE